MISVAVFLAAFVTVGAIVCTPDMCDGVEKTPLTCPGSVIEGGGFCGCTDSCAKVEGDLCEKSPLLLWPLSHDECDTGLVCDSVGSSLLALLGKGKCVRDTQRKRFVLDDVTACQKMKIVKASQPTYSDKWIPKCDVNGAFESMQCDLAGRCFCVNSAGQIQGSRVQGKVTCPSA
ncbi:thyroglobulin-like [Haliotis asinina]|uniref:thyroglobulin-like n=1 Tax=Haliotis asinina TaxID=109174 RepID=UPI0035319D9A